MQEATFRLLNTSERQILAYVQLRLPFQDLDNTMYSSQLRLCSGILDEDAAKTDRTIGFLLGNMSLVEERVPSNEVGEAVGATLKGYEMAKRSVLSTEAGLLPILSESFCD